jgi:hypothetical protein
LAALKVAGALETQLMKKQLSDSQRHTYEAIAGDSMTHDLEWQDLRALLGALVETVEEKDGELKITGNGNTLFLQPTDKSFVSTEQLREVRQFLERSGTKVLAPAAKGGRLFVVIDHRQARIYQAEAPGSLPERIVPYDPDGAGRHLHNVDNDANGQRRPERKSFYEAVAKTLRGAEQILLFGPGTGASSAMVQLLAELERHHPDLARRVVGSVPIDEKHTTEPELLARAREFYAKVGPRPLRSAESGTE